MRIHLHCYSQMTKSFKEWLIGLGPVADSERGRYEKIQKWFDNRSTKAASNLDFFK